ncbi:hypothetical protein [Pararhizobium sp. DWP3-4]|uniref:hypothetical protein n=1 Tax=Pararhizobium sp. DWP3-4 TaxID=2804565 RepID=UPI003CF5D135
MALTFLCEGARQSVVDPSCSLPAAFRPSCLISIIASCRTLSSRDIASDDRTVLHFSAGFAIQEENRWWMLTGE